MALQVASFRFYAELNDFLPPTKPQIPFAYPFYGMPTIKEAIEDVFDERLALARSLGATHTVNAKAPQLVDEVRRLAGGRGAQCCLEAAGVLEALRAAVEVLALRGTACLVGSARAGVEVHLEMRTIQQGRTVRRCVQGDSDVQTFLPRLIALYRAGQLPIERLVRHYPHAAINDAVADMLIGTTIKAVLQIGTA
jgi:aryl-alcohol dehydrogenase